MPPLRHLAGEEDPAPLQHQVIEFTPITPLVIEHRLVSSCCSTSTCATLPASVEAGHHGSKLSALVGLLGRWLMHTDRDLAALGGLVVSSGLAWGYGLTIEVEHDRPRRRTLCELYVKEGDRCARVKSICAWMPLRWRQQGTSHGSRQAPPWAPSTTAISRCWPMCSCPTPDPDGAPPAAGLWMAKQTSSTSAVNPQAPQPHAFALQGRASSWRSRDGKYWRTMQKASRARLG